jgi:electron transfer flavoprotein alpha/beta subunit
MSDYIVLVKQVPDVSQITDNAFDPETGTLVRSRLANVVNELDAQALAFARYMKQISGDAKARIIALTMGPPMAEEVLRYSLARAADQVVLLTDRALGGADTWATANPLAYAIRRIVKEILHCGDDYFVVAGMQSVDGDTAQVPGQIAEELQLPCIAYATGAEYKKKRFEFTRIISGGSQTVATRKMPAVITVAKYEYPLFATFAGTRWANKGDVVKWGADDINATHIGATGSKTAVIRVFPPGKSTRKCQEVKDVKSLAKIIVESFKSGNGDGGKADEGPGPYVLPARRKSLLERPYEATKKEQDDYDILTGILKEMKIADIAKLDDATKDKVVEKAGGAFHKKALEDMIGGFGLVEPAFKGEVWVVAEHSGDGVVHPATFELTGKARELADSLETKVGVCIAGRQRRAHGRRADCGRRRPHLRDRAQTAQGVRSDGLPQSGFRCDRQVRAADRAVRSDAAGTHAGSDGFVQDGLRPDRRLHGPRHSRQLSQRRYRPAASNPSGPRRERHGDDSHEELQEPDGDGPARRDEADPRRPQAQRQGYHACGRADR